MPRRDGSPGGEVPFRTAYIHRFGIFVRLHSGSVQRQARCTDIRNGDFRSLHDDTKTDESARVDPVRLLDFVRRRCDRVFNLFGVLEIPRRNPQLQPSDRYR